MANLFIKATASLFDKMLNTFTVLDVRAWQPPTIYEVDIKIPSANMYKWKTIQRIKCKVDELEYRDYTPALWNPETKICTLFIEAGHEGAGSRWVKNIKVGEELYGGTVHAAKLPSNEGKVLCLGDGSALAHFLALKQLTKREDYPLEVMLALHDDYILNQDFLFENPEFEFIPQLKNSSLNCLTETLQTKDLSSYISIYIAGYIPMVTGLRKILKKNPYLKAKIFVYGFWS